MTTPDQPTPMDLWERAAGDQAEYMRLLREHGMVIDGPSEPLPCGWTPNRAVPANPYVHGTTKADLDAAFERGVAEGRRQAARFIANEIRAELVCCDIYEHAHGNEERVEQAEQSGHAICFWGEAAARLAEGRDDEEPEPPSFTGFEMRHRSPEDRIAYLAEQRARHVEMGAPTAWLEAFDALAADADTRASVGTVPVRHARARRRQPPHLHAR